MLDSCKMVEKGVWSIPYISVAAFFPSLKQNFIAYHSFKVSSHPDCIFEIHQLWLSGFSRVYSNSCCSYSFEREIIKIGQSSHKRYSNIIVNFQESTTILNASTKKSGNLLNVPHISGIWKKYNLPMKHTFMMSSGMLCLNIVSIAGNLSWGWPVGSLFDSYYTMV